MLIEFLWPEAWQLKVDTVTLADDKLLIMAHGTQHQANCPDCGEQSRRHNGRYHRHPDDLPCTGYAVQFQLTVPRFFCDNEVCMRRTFAAAFPDILPRYARRTTRLMEQQQEIGFVTSGEAGSRLSDMLGMFTSPDTLIRLVRQAPEPEVYTPRILGVDDWAKRKGHNYGTVLVDLEAHKVVDLLDERSAEALIQWLKEHPGVEVIVRDRGPDYIEGATRGAPDAIQVADRFHLFQNVVDALKRFLEKQPKKLREAARAVTLETQELVAHQTEEAEPGERDRLQSERELRFLEVKELQKQGWTRRAVARHLQMSRRTVRKYFELEACPQWPSKPQSTSTVTPHLPYIISRWQEGCQNIRQLHQEILSQGFDGHYSSVYRAIAGMLDRGELSKVHMLVRMPVLRLSPTSAAWLLIHPDEKLDETQLKLREKLCASSSDIKYARQLAQSFCRLLRERLPEQLDAWLLAAEGSGIKVLHNFAIGLRRDYDAVKAALTYEWSSGQVEGQINRLKFIKRQAYGRAKFDLLRRRVIGMPLLA